jgi:hypothetical protein
MGEQNRTSAHQSFEVFSVTTRIGVRQLGPYAPGVMNLLGGCVGVDPQQ